MVNLTPEAFEELVGRALDRLPAELAGLLDNVVILVADEDPDDPDLLGLYQGIPLTERGSGYAGALPDTVTIYRCPTLAMCESQEEVAKEVQITVVHELAHHFGIDDDRLAELGYD